MFPYPLPHILQPDDQLYFLHIPKTAGTTLYALLDQHYPLKDICPEQLSSKVKKIPLEELARYRLIHGHLDYNFIKLLPKKPIIITMLRDPVERIISLYEYWKRNIEEWVADQPKHNNSFRRVINKDLYGFVCDEGDDIVQHEVENNQTRRIFSQCEDKLEGLSENKIVNALKSDWKKNFFFFGLLEKFDKSLDLLCFSLAWEPVRRYERKNVSSARQKSSPNVF